MKFYYHVFKWNSSIYSNKKVFGRQYHMKNFEQHAIFWKTQKMCVCKYVYTQVLSKSDIHVRQLHNCNYRKIIYHKKIPDFSIESSYFLQENSINWFYHFSFTSFFTSHHQQITIASFLANQCTYLKLNFYMPIYYFKLYVYYLYKI